MNKTAWIITPCAPDTLFDSYQAISPSDIIIAVDGGLERCLALGIEADYLCGDLDSLEHALLQAFPREKTLRFPQDKDETDTELALMKVSELGFRNAVICNDMQGRVDHVLGLIQNLQWAQLHGVKACVQSKSQKLFIVDNSFHAKGYQGCLLSLVALNQPAHFQRSSGLKWNLKNLVLEPHLSRGISNQITGENLEIELAEGTVLATITKIG
ncbi:MAG TPA: thiamine diphosphokinase [Candidatus Cloacimonadota bacterium]|nr:thiamine diphosphokinase [Candidatus Cloacimonadota bacterium]